MSIDFAKLRDQIPEEFRDEFDRRTRLIEKIRASVPEDCSPDQYIQKATEVGLMQSLDDGIHDYGFSFSEPVTTPILEQYSNKKRYRLARRPRIETKDGTSEILREINGLLENSGYQNFLKAYSLFENLPEDRHLEKSAEEALAASDEPLGFETLKAKEYLESHLAGDSSPTTLFFAGFHYARAIALKKRGDAIRGVKMEPKRASKQKRINRKANAKLCKDYVMV